MLNADECYELCLQNLVPHIEQGIKIAAGGCKTSYCEKLTFKIPDYILNKFKSKGFRVRCQCISIPWIKNDENTYIYLFSWGK